MAQPTFVIPYDENFLGDGFVVPAPTLTGRAHDEAHPGGLIDYIHYSLSMNRVRRVAAFTAHNVDAGRVVKGIGRGGTAWRLDERIPADAQLGSEVYADNAWDRGHLVRREDVLWGTKSVAREANKATFFYTNAAPQHENFNQDEWLGLEDWVLHRAPEFSYRLCVFTGPVLSDDDRPLGAGDPQLRAGLRGVSDDVLIPAAFWKVVVLRDETAGGDDLSVVAFAMRQSDLWQDHDGRRLLRLKTYQVTLAQIQAWTALDFGELGRADELEWSDGFRRMRDLGTGTPYQPISGPDDIVFSGDQRRRRIGRTRVAHDRAAAMTSAGDRAAATDAAHGCGCSGAEFDARGAIAALSRKIAELARAIPRTAERGPERGLELPAPRDKPDGVAPEDWKAATMALDSTRRRTNGADRIVGGSDAAAGEFPSCVCIGDPTRFFCTGALIHPRIVLTAAHCGTAITRVMVGGTDIGPPANGRMVAVARAFRHSRYNRFAATRNDITLLVLAAPAEVDPIILATDADLAAAAETTLAGFGYNDLMAPVGFGLLRRVVVALGPIQTAGADHAALGDALGYDPATEFVAGRKSLGRDSCNGDSGGPAYIDLPDGARRLAGLTSRATSEASTSCGDGGIYVRPYQYRQWIVATAAAAGIALELAP